MHILSNSFLRPLEEAQVPILNLHPALPGQYDGAGMPNPGKSSHSHQVFVNLLVAGAIERAFEDFQKGRIRQTGVMVHYVIELVDQGQSVKTQEVPIESTDTLADLEQRLHTVEHELIVQGTKIALEKLSKASI